MKYFNRLVLIVSVIFFSACSFGKPSEDEAKDVLNKSLSKYDAKILSFRKLNGKEYKIHGQDVYELQFSANIVYPKGVNTQCLRKNMANVKVNGVIVGKDWMNPNRLMKCLPMMKVKDIGEKENIKGVILFEKTDNGWVGKAYKNGIFGLEKI